MDCFVAMLLAKTGAYGLLCRYAPRKDGGVWIALSLCSSQRRGRMDCFVAMLLAKTGAYGLLRRYAPRKVGAEKPGALKILLINREAKKAPALQ